MIDDDRILAEHDPVRWVRYTYEGQDWAAGYAHGGLVMADNRGGWWVQSPKPPYDKTTIRNGELDQLKRLWPTHAGLDVLPGQDDLAPPPDPEDQRLSYLRSRLLTSRQVRELPAPTPLIDGILTRSTLAVLWGHPGSGKSFLALDWAMSIGTGSWWFGHPIEAGRVLYVAAEGAGGLGSRLEAWETGRRTHDTHDNVQVLPVAVNFLDPGWVGPVVNLASDLNPVLIILDTLARLMVGGDENSAKDMGRLIDAAGAIQTATAATVLPVHHDTKDGGTMRGSSALLGAVDPRTTSRRRCPHTPVRKIQRHRPLRPHPTLANPDRPIRRPHRPATGRQRINPPRHRPRNAERTP